MAINRANQTWPEDVTVNLVQHEGELKPLGRNLAMKMLLEKAEPANKQQAPA